MFEEFFGTKHIALIRKCLRILPSAYASFQSNRPTVLHFLLMGLDILNRLDVELSNEERRSVIDWIYDQQLGDDAAALSNGCGGFRGTFVCRHRTDSIANGSGRNDDEIVDAPSDYDCGHLAQTYTALCTLLALGDDLSRVDRHATLTLVSRCQKTDGSFCALASQDTENDMRFVFCATAICFILNDFTYVDVDRIADFIRRSVNYDGGIGQAPHCESHGGSTYCAISSLVLMGRLWDYSVLGQPQIEHLIRWAVFKQDIGFHGRTNKPDDSCYAFWVGATLTMLSARHLIDDAAVRQFLMLAQDMTIGGFSKYEDSMSDVLHTYFSLAALANLGEPLLQPIFAPLNVTCRAHERLLRLHSRQT